MKAVWILYDIVIDGDVTGAIREAAPGGYTRWPRLTGDGPQSGPRLDTAVWPGANAAILAVREDGEAAALMARLQALRDEVGRLTGVWAFTMPVLEALK